MICKRIQLEIAGYEISEVPKKGNKAKFREIAKKGNVIFLECIKCGYFKSFSLFPDLKRGYLNKNSFCLECKRKKGKTWKEETKERLTKKQKEELYINTKQVRFKIKKEEGTYKVLYIVGDSSALKPTGESGNTHSEARSKINENLAKEIEMKLKREEEDIDEQTFKKH